MNSFKMIGYDLDGVLISDLNWPDDMSLEEFLEMRRSEPRANFVPQGNYVIITGRNATDRAYTLQWIKENLSDNPPLVLHHACIDHREGARYKANVINREGIKIFIESDAKQVEYLKANCPNCKVYHFGSFINESIAKL